jgi:3-deoxy-7-phosphoheptulonate synthase
MAIKWAEVSKDSSQVIIELSNGHKIGSELTIIAGPCAVESYEQLLETAKIVSLAGANVLRAGAFKPRTSHKDFEGHGEEGLKLLSKIRDELGLPFVTEIMDQEDIPLFQKYNVDIYQVGARNCQNFRLLDALSKIDKPVLLKRGSTVSFDEFMNCAARVYRGNKKVILCERGDKSFDKAYRNILNLNDVANMKLKSCLPVIVDPSHGTGVRELVIPLSCAGIASGADGVMVEVHCNPSEALCDGAQSINEEINELVDKIKKVYSSSSRVSDSGE